MVLLLWSDGGLSPEELEEWEAPLHEVVVATSQLGTEGIISRAIGAGVPGHRIQGALRQNHIRTIQIELILLIGFSLGL